jgi:hypothetical protein
MATYAVFITGMHGEDVRMPLAVDVALSNDTEDGFNTRNT